MPLIVCPECAENISSEAKQCPHCGFPLKKLGTTSQVSSPVENATEVTYTPVNTPQRLASGIVFLLVSPFIFMIPCIGWVIGAVMFFMGLGILFMRKEDLSQIKGDCPYCMLPIEGVYSQKSIPCSHCKQNIIFKKGYFLTTAAATNPQLNLPDRTDLMIPPVANNNATLKWTVVIAALVIGGIIVAAQIDWSSISPQHISVITPTVDEPKPDAALPTPTPAPHFPRTVVASREISVKLDYGLMRIRKGKEFILTGQTSSGLSAQQGDLKFTVTHEDYTEK